MSPASAADLAPPPPPPPADLALAHNRVPSHARWNAPPTTTAQHHPGHGAPRGASTKRGSAEAAEGSGEKEMSSAGEEEKESDAEMRSDESRTDSSGAAHRRSPPPSPSPIGHVVADGLRVEQRGGRPRPGRGEGRLGVPGAVPSHTRAAFCGSRISATHFPHGRRPNAPRVEEASVPVATKEPVHDAAGLGGFENPRIVESSSSPWFSVGVIIGRDKSCRDGEERDEPAPPPLASAGRGEWRSGCRCLPPRDVAMALALEQHRQGNRVCH
uniref:Uncharacterized protein n=1 Tax=Zea mays TaxID=4577 RepID=A0A804QVX9_MAIZE